MFCDQSEAQKKIAMAKYLDGVLGQMCWLGENHDRWLNITKIYRILALKRFFLRLFFFCSNKMAAKMSLTP